MFLDRRCPGCRRPAGSLCRPCREHLAFRAVRTVPCGGAGPAEAATIAGLDSLTAAFRYDVGVGRIIVGAKNGGRRDVLRSLTQQLADPLDGHALRRRPDGTVIAAFDVVCWVPASRRRALRRGYDQGAVIARVLARRYRIRARPLLSRVGSTAQANLDRRDRLVGPSIAIAARPPRRILLVDDVATTGASLAAAATTLRSAGAECVAGAVLAVVGAPGEWGRPS